MGEADVGLYSALVRRVATLPAVPLSQRRRLTEAECCWGMVEVQAAGGEEVYERQ